MYLEGGGNSFPGVRHSHTYCYFNPSMIAGDVDSIGKSVASSYGGSARAFAISMFFASLENTLLW